MLFNSLQFLVFFPVVTILYFLFPHDKRWILLLVASAIFYMAFIPQYILILIVLIFVDYFAGLWIESSKGAKRRLSLLLSITANVGILSVFKYFNFFSSNVDQVLALLGISARVPYLSIILPLGLSFHVFQSMSYTIEVYKRKVKAERHLGIYALYVMFYPQLVAGPIERPYGLLPQLHEEHEFDVDRVFNGLKLMLWGFFKKVVIADRLAVLVNIVYASPTSYSGMELLLATYFFAIQILCDFSGYSDIAIGAALVMGINLRQNFNNPYISSSVSEFWNRWHMSLSTWFRDYVYIPLGGNRVSKIRWCFNIMVVFLVSGLWHGADWKFVLWGALHGLFVIIGSFLSEKIKGITKFISVFMTFNLVSLAWVFFRAQSIGDGFVIIQRIFTSLVSLRFIHEVVGSAFIKVNKQDIVSALGVIAFGLIIFVFNGSESIRNLLSGKPKLVRWAVYYTLILGIIFYGVFNKTKFIYFQF